MTPFRCPICDAGMVLAHTRHGRSYFWCEEDQLVGRGVPQVGEIYNPQLGYEALQAAKSGEGQQLLGAVANLLLRGTNSPGIEDPIFVYGAGEGELVRMLAAANCMVKGFEPRPSFWPILKQAGMTDLFLPHLTANPIPVHTFIGLDDLWMERAGHVLAWFNPEVTVVAPLLFPGDLRVEGYPEYALSRNAGLFTFTQQAFLKWVELHWAGEPTVQFIPIASNSVVRVIGAPIPSSPGESTT